MTDQKSSADDFKADAERLEGHVRWGEAHGMGEGLSMIAEVAKNLREAARRLRNEPSAADRLRQHEPTPACPHCGSTHRVQPTTNACAACGREIKGEVPPDRIVAYPLP